ncbi:hypothetical protein V6N11_031300 [Hibiscus sabdariffa]|uniref:Uncharacterized protein n=1 Tax=Hibiscus sabdariffa TaxID=183260 RepID=A0ABR2SXS7_9ROSI
MVGVASTGDVEQSTHVECPGSSATRVESQMANGEVTGYVASSTHASQLPEDSLAHGLNDEALEQVDIDQPVAVTDQVVEEGVNVMDPVQSEGTKCQEGVSDHNAGIKSAWKSVSWQPNMPQKLLIPMLRILVLLLSLSVLMRPTSTTNTNFIGNKVKEEVRRKLIDAKPPPNNDHPGQGE